MMRLLQKHVTNTVVPYNYRRSGEIYRMAAENANRQGAAFSVKAGSMTFTFAQKVLFKHCDPAGIVFFPRYFEMMNDCVEAFFDDIGFPFETVLQQSGVPTGQIQARFHAPSRHGDHLLLTLSGTRLGRSTFDFTIETTSGEQRRMSYAATLVFINADGKSTPWPSDMRSALTPFVQTED